MFYQVNKSASVLGGINKQNKTTTNIAWKIIATMRDSNAFYTDSWKQKTHHPFLRISVLKPKGPIYSDSS